MATRGAIAQTPDGLPVVMAGRADADGVLALVNAVQPHIPWSEADLAWQYFDGPGETPARLYAIRDGERLVALYGAVAKPFRLGPRTVTGFMIQDVMTDPAYRGRGYLNFLAGLCAEDIRNSDDIGYTFPNKQSENSFRRNGWHALMTVPMRGKTPVGARTGDGVDLEELPGPLGDRATSVWRDSGLACGVERTGPAIDWRYGRPGVIYRRFAIPDGAGFVVLKRYAREDGPLVHICDLVVTAAARGRLPAFLGAIEAVAARDGAAALTAWLPPGHPYAEAFDSYGLRIDPTHDRVMFVTGRAPMQPLLADPAAWHLSQGDSDVY
ncbi:MAG: GNAT family N-acetyltransferase [Rhodospirillaceae bacterium]|nr:GNAT family N-acetyltransferase [Rhodospirillaceae bacterium]